MKNISSVIHTFPNMEESKILLSDKKVLKIWPQTYMYLKAMKKTKSQQDFLKCLSGSQIYVTLTLSQTTNFRLFQNQRICRQEF